MRPPSDATLARRSLAGDERAFVELVRRHEQPLAALIRRYIDDASHAEDVLQETLLQAWLGLGALRDAGKFRIWILQVARNRCRDFLKSAQRRQLPTEHSKLENRVNRFGRSVARIDEAAEDAIKALKKISPAEQHAARLFYLKGLSISDIAKRSRCPAGTVKRRLFYARQQLRRALGAQTKLKEN